MPESIPVQTQWGDDLTGDLKIEQKQKIKTRDEKTQPEPIDDQPPPIPNKVKETIKITVNKTSLALFKNMFPDPDDEQPSKKSFKWDAFARAMTDSAGFIARHAGGSEVRFEPGPESKWFGMGKIVFHKPHPDPTIDHLRLRCMGKRMWKWFGWSGDTFVLAEKEKVDGTGEGKKSGLTLD